MSRAFCSQLASLIRESPSKHSCCWWCLHRNCDDERARARRSADA